MNENRKRLAGILVIVGVLCIGLAAIYMIREQREADRLAAMAASVQAEREAAERTEPSTAAPEPTEPEPTEPEMTEEERRRAELAAAQLAAYGALKEDNEDLFGWLTIEDTVIDYPIMYTPDDPEYYLNRDFDGNDSVSGLPFLDGNTDPEVRGNYLLHGHNMRNKTMFATILNYEDPEYLEEHRYLYFDTMEEVGVYEVVAACRARIRYANEEGFRYYFGTKLDTEEKFNEYVEGVREMAAYDTGFEAAFGDELITLSTCAYHTENGRFFIVAKRIPLEESDRWTEELEGAEGGSVETEEADGSADE